MSEEHKIYLKKKKHQKIIIVTIQLLLIILFILIWKVLTDNKIIDSFIFSSPKNVLKTIFNLYKSNNLFKHIFITVYEVIVSFLFGSLIGLLIATLMWYFPLFAKVIDPYLTTLNSLPKVALGPIIIIWCGSGIKSIILMALLISVIITTISVYQNFKEVDSNKIKLMNTLGCNKFQLFYMLILPSNISNIVSILKVSISMSLIGVIMGEFLVSKEGIGYLILYGSQVFNLNLVISGIIILCIISIILYYSILLCEKIIKRRN